MAKRSNLVGAKFGRLTVVASGDGPGWVCACECGGSKVVTAKSLNAGHTASCGCLAAEVLARRNTTHGASRSRTYRSWKDMRGRCLNSNDSDFADYGGRGITIAPAWADFTAFYADMGERPAGMTLDREDVNGNYEPGNCRWATAKQQANNKRTNHVIEREGQRKTLAQWCGEVGIDPSKVRYRLAQGWPVASAFSLEDFRR